MSIVPLKKLTLYGCIDEKSQVLEDLQTLGCLHIVPLATPENVGNGAGPSSHAREAAAYLAACPQKLRQIRDASSFDPASIEQQVLQNKRTMGDLEDERDSLTVRIRELKPWGNFAVPDPAQIGNLTLWFYILPHKEFEKINTDSLCFQMVQKDNRFCYIVVVCEQEPEGIPGNRVVIGPESRAQLENRLEQVELELEDLRAERLRLTRWLHLFHSNLFRLEDQFLLQEATRKTYDEDPVFALQAWVPASDSEQVRTYAASKNLAIVTQDADATETPPTLLKNNPMFGGGQHLLSFYMTPNYRLWDPSVIVFFSFAVFFAMIFSDAGYAVLLGGVLALYWKRMGQTLSGRRFRIVLLTLTVFSVIWGILAGSYFGVTPSERGVLGGLKIFDMNNYAMMMGLSIVVGVIHIVIANLAQAWALRRSPRRFGCLGWAVALVGGILIFISPKVDVAALKTLGMAMLVCGFGAVVVFTSTEKPAWKRILSGLIGLTRISGMFGDVLSYLRLFALGLASASLAAVFNDLARQVYSALPGFKVICALLILLIGHGMNFGLSIMSGFIHGLRLNFIEFFNWGLPDEGSPFKAFSRKEITTWNR